MNSTLKVVWLCMFVNKEFKDRFNTPDLKNWGVWITHLCNLFNDVHEVDLHVVAPNIYTNTNETITSGRITYHFYKHQHDVPNVTSKPSVNPLNLNMINVDVVNIIRRINPDIIHLHGNEKSTYSSPALLLNKEFPSVMTVQRFNFMATGESVEYKFVLKFEESVLREFKHFGVRTLEMEQIIKERNPKAKLYFHNYPVAWPTTIKTHQEEETFDVVFFARITRDKGIFDLIESATQIVKIRPDYSVRLIGPIRPNEKDIIFDRIRQAGLEKHIQYIGNIEDQQKLHEEAAKARICVLPTHADIVPGTIIESMLMKLPVISYAVGGMPQLNEPGLERINLIEKGDITGLTEATLHLLESNKKRHQLAEDAYNFATEYYSDKKVIADLLTMYENVLK